jgi:Histidine kinase
MVTCFAKTPGSCGPLACRHSAPMNVAHAGVASAPRLDDVAAILLLSPVLGVAVGWITGVTRDLPAAGPARWLGILALAAIAVVIWVGNRNLYYLVRESKWAIPARLSPRRRIALVIGYAVAFSAPLGYAALHAWYWAFSPNPANHDAIRSATALITVTSLFIAHAYEAILLAEQRIALEQGERRRLEAEIRGLEGQLDPHFLYNALCSLGFLIETNRARAGAYVARLSSVYAYVTQTHAARLVSLEEELAFARAFAELLKLQHANAIAIEIPDPGDAGARRIVPVSIQLAIENAAKHNDMAPGRPLRIEVRLAIDQAGDWIEVINNKNPSRNPPAPSGVGLRNLSSRCLHCVGRDVRVIDTEDEFRVLIPLLSPPTVP